MRSRQPRDHPRWMPQYAAMRPRAGDKGQGHVAIGKADEEWILVSFRETTKMDNDTELLRLLVRNIPFISSAFSAFLLPFRQVGTP